ncbi:unnamed protein product [Prorocentrum cordatum]|uniref:HMG box domain-containing protein n=1 Tax=Prorocentrum cordatum TaxID=2364126 RepID=A0ABN9U489_9DINO|nr:unnamed protein product [Polarella glacialis]
MDVFQHILQYSKPSYVLEGRDIHRVQQICEVSKAFLRVSFTKFVQERQAEPLLECFISDGTPLTTVELHCESFGRWKVRRFARDTREFLTQRVFIMDTNYNARVLFEDPQVMGDKTVLTHHNAQNLLWGGARMHGHTGPLVTWGVWDRAISSGMGRRMRQRAKAYYLHMQNTIGKDAAYMLWLWTWVVCTHCKCHDLHNALKWAIVQQLLNRAALRSCWIALESVRNGYSVLTRALPFWLPLRVTHEDRPTAVLKELWTLLGVPDDWMPLFLSLQIVFLDGKLRVCSSLESEDAAQRITVVLLHAWKFTRWSDSRWCGLGKCTRCMLLVVCLGLSDLVQWIRDSKQFSTYYINGWKHMTPEVIRMACVTSCTSGLSEEPLATLLEDDRLAQKLPEIKTKLEEQRSCALSLSDEVLSLLGSIAGLSLREMRNEIFLSVLVQYGYIKNKLRDVEQLPFALVQGDIRANLEQLRKSPPVSEPTARKIQLLTQIPVPMEELEAAVRLLGEGPHTSTSSEHGHVKASRLLRSHRRYCRSTMRARCMVSTFQTLVGESKMEQALCRLNFRLECWRKKQPNRITPRQAYISCVMRQARQERRLRITVRKDFTKDVIRNHGRAWKALSMRQKLSFVGEARVLRDERQEHIQNTISLILGKRRQLMEKMEKDRAPGAHGLRMRSCALTQAMKAEFEALYAADSWTQSSVDAAREACSEPVGPPSPADVRTLDLMELESEGGVGRGQPPWLGWVCHHRDFFRTCCFRWVADGSTSVWKFSYATQSPLQVCAVKCAELACPEPTLLPSDQGAAELDVWEHNFTVDWSTWGYSDEGLFPIAGKVEVLGDVIAGRDSHLGSDAAWVDLEELRAAMPEGPKANARKQAPDVEAEPAADEPELWAEHPYFWEDVAHEEPGGEDGESCAGSDMSDNSCSDDGEDVDSAMEALWERRRDLAVFVDMPIDDKFRWALRGGKWTYLHKGVAYDSYRACAVKGVPCQWCCLYGVARSRSYSIAAYAEENCITLVHAWCHRLAFLFDLWVLRGGPCEYCYTPEDIDKYREPDAFQALAAQAAGELAKCVLQLRSIRPKKPKGAHACA